MSMHRLRGGAAIASISVLAFLPTVLCAYCEILFAILATPLVQHPAFHVAYKFIGRGGRCRAALLTAATLLLTPITAPAASISVTPGRDGAAKIVVSGSLIVGDGSTFASRTGTVGRAVVWFESEGGDLTAALAIGDTIAHQGFATFVPGWALCASGCALAWLAGSPHTMEAGARIGFHGAYNKDTRQESAGGNARVGAYLTRLGLPNAVVYATSAPHDGMTWLDPAEAERYGITVYLSGAQGPPAQPAPPPLRAAQAAKPEVAKDVSKSGDRPKDTPARTQPEISLVDRDLRPIPPDRPPRPWMIQVGVFADLDEAKQRLGLVQSRAARFLASADPFTEMVTKGDTTLYRARFGGLAKEQAEAACNYLKFNDVECMVVVGPGLLKEEKAADELKAATPSPAPAHTPSLAPWPLTDRGNPGGRVLAYDDPTKPVAPVARPAPIGNLEVRPTAPPDTTVAVKRSGDRPTLISSSSGAPVIVKQVVERGHTDSPTGPVLDTPDRRHEKALVENPTSNVIPDVIPAAVFMLAASANWVWIKLTGYGATDILSILIMLLVFNCSCYFFQSTAYKIVRAKIAFLVCLVFCLIAWRDTFAIIFIATGSAFFVTCYHLYKRYVQYKEAMRLQQEYDKLGDLIEDEIATVVAKDVKEREVERKLRESLYELILRELKTRMAAAHPDRGGTTEEFIVAHKRYKEAQRRQSTRDATPEAAPA
jgi:hypothetical protein